MKQDLKIGFDAKRLFHNRTGLGNYSRDVVRGIQKSFPKVHITLFSPSVSQHNFVVDILENKSTSIVSAKVSKWFFGIWRTFLLPKIIKENRIDVYHGLSHEIPRFRRISEVKYVVTVHDLIFLRYPENYPFLDRVFYQWKLKHACSKADKIVAISEQTKKDLIHFYTVPATKIEVVYQSCAEQFKSDKSNENWSDVRSKYSLPLEFILNVGTIEKRKNLVLLLQANHQAKKQLPIVVIGKKKKYFQEVEQWISKNSPRFKILFLEGVNLDELVSIYQQASLFVYPSVFEGFGIPIVEALYSKVPVIAAKGSCLEEAGGPHSVYVDPTNSAALAIQIDELLLDETKRQTMIEEGVRYASNFTNETQAKALMNIYQELKA